MIILKLILFVLLFLLSFPILVLFIQVIASLGYKGRNVYQTRDSHYCVAIIIPAHNESLGIVSTVQSILPQLRKQDRIIVVADNCTDDTKDVALKLGADVIVRNNPEQRGKGYALDFGIQALKTDPPDVVIMIDADCIISANGITELSQACIRHQRPVQALDLMTAPINASFKVKVAEFAWVVKNLVRPLGLKVMGMPCQLMGTGMAFLWNDIKVMHLANGHIAEDMKLGLDFCRLGKAPLFLPFPNVKSIFPASDEAIKSQRTRWEHGHLSLIFNDALPLFVEAVRTKNFKMASMTFDLLVPPLAALSLMLVSITVLNFSINQFVSISFLLILNVFILILLITSIVVAWFFYSRHVISFKQLCYTPFYALVKIPIYIKFLINRQVKWVRAKRD